METFTHNGYTVKIIQDEDCSSPRENDNACVLALFHRRYRLGDKDHGYRDGDYNGWEEMYKAIVRDHKPVCIFPVSLIDHSGISVYLGDSAHWADPGGWDSGQVGFAYVTREKALAEWGRGGKRVTKHVRDMAERCLRAEVEAYDKYIRGDCWAYVVETPDGEQIDSCCGFIGYDYCVQEAKDSCPSEPAMLGGVAEDAAHEATLC